MYSSRVWTVRPLGIFLDSFVEVFFGCCFAVALGLDPRIRTRQRAPVRFSSRSSAPTPAMCGCRSTQRRISSFSSWSCVPLFRVFLPGQFLVIFPKTQLSAFYGLFDNGAFRTAPFLPTFRCRFAHSGQKQALWSFPIAHPRSLAEVSSISLAYAVNVITAPQSSQKKSPFHSLYLTIMPPPRQGFRRGRARARRLSRRRCSSRSAA